MDARRPGRGEPGGGTVHQAWLSLLGLHVGECTTSLDWGLQLGPKIRCDLLRSPLT